MTDTEFTVLRAVGIVVLLYSLYRAARYFSAKRQHDAVRELQAYFNDVVCPRSELAPHLQEIPVNRGPLRAGKPARPEAFCPKEWVDKESMELESPYYLRTGQQISALSTMRPEGSWYGLEAWIRDILASKGNPIQRGGTEPEEKTGK